MDNIKNDSYYLSKIIVDLEFIIEHTKDKNQVNIENDAVLVDSIMFRLIQISENSDKLTPSFKETMTALPWRDIKGMRNKIVHNYGSVDMSIIYNTVKFDIPHMLDILTH